MIPEDILQILACPVCKKDLIYTENSFVCTECKLEYPIIDDIPVFLIEEAKKLTDEDIKKMIEKER
ncbi:MAG TPA: tetraacyldisaccharide 4'-kinase [Persephonella sp.]|uniref:Tetraacyldisaccharide 4'-kinase (Lipid A 4'-kinase) n=1 Tax=Persephonella marina (strain DSM 14350 / EX-H1) TaxID=123214 RepID=C0QQG4_PERMH|nr:MULTISPECIES: Trm112 family protein [Persephonella]ACO03292.1 tetraacyldisaccharide 4'-kinase (Lipid A 4'-kinase) [Persephonella marina EX-H1]HCB69484.1 tetraacyldisaccharide 4'-kinase [Persephonella sp.]